MSVQMIYLQENKREAAKYRCPSDGEHDADMNPT